MITTLPADSEARKGIPLLRGCFNYFSAALAGVARWSKLGNEKHNKGEEMHHARGKSPDHGDCILRHLMDIQDLQAAIDRAGSAAFDPAGILDEADALAWRALALSQELHERFAGAPLAPGAKEPSPQMSFQLLPDGPEFPDGPVSDGFAPGFEERAGFIKTDGRISFERERRHGR